jgi:hypothetical protein
MLARWCLASAAIALTASATACMTSPGDGFRVASRTSQIEFSGFSDIRGDTVTVQAFNFNTNAYENVVTTTTVNESTGSFWGADW